jgi:hypothetical protein
MLKKSQNRLLRARLGKVDLDLQHVTGTPKHFFSILLDRSIRYRGSHGVKR